MSSRAFGFVEAYYLIFAFLERMEGGRRESERDVRGGFRSKEAGLDGIVNGA